MKTIVGIGLGPANLSLAALIEGSVAGAPLRDSCLFLETDRNFNWHNGQLFPGSRMQNSFVRDLVSLVDPTNRLSFLSFLKSHGRLLQFLNSGLFFPTREEFVQYFEWVASEVPTIRFGTAVTSVSFDEEGSFFEVLYERDGRQERAHCKNVVVGTGLEPAGPPFKGVPGEQCCHVSEFLIQRPSLSGKSVAIIGAAQSAAELLDYILGLDRLPDEITWVTRGSNFRQLDTGNFSREFYTPGYGTRFYAISEEAKRQILIREGGAEHGISPGLLESLYQRLYLLRHVVNEGPRIRLVPGTEVREVDARSDLVRLDCYSWVRGTRLTLTADHTVLCTGFRLPRLEILRPLEKFGLRTTPPHEVSENYSLKWDGPQNRRVFVQSLGRKSHGLA
ncbi:MAG TPA: SidA/IucD/PvdA family monooxygenase, partial [Actinomycetota bacterium]|nr:SidA/IucD/PvdA family monooxygenase [Actinomycetota bacterium]